MFFILSFFNCFSRISQEEETRRIEAAGGAVLLGRVNGELAVSRAFGDFCYKDRDDLRLDEQAVSNRSFQ